MKKIIYVLLSLFSTRGPVIAQTGAFELPPGYTSGNYTNVATLIQQIQSSPAPRFKAGHTLMPNYSWIDPLYAGGYKQSGIADATACHNANDIQQELAKNFNYNILLFWGGTQINDSSVSLANMFPIYKRGITTLRAQTKGCSGSSCLWCQCLASDHYLQNSTGQFLGWAGEIISYKGTWRPTSNPADWNQDGINAKNLVNASLTNLIGNVDYINEDAEVYPVIENAGLNADPVVKAAMGSLNPQIYLANKVTLLDNAYRDQILSLPKMQGARYSEYILCGHRTYALFWEGTRNISTAINGQHYPTTDFYPRWPNNWQNWTSAWHGLKWVTQSRYYELLQGDKLYSPYFGLGWDANIENNILSAQGLGLAKLLSIYGAEYFFPAYFIETQTNIPNPKSYAYQYLVPAYAQAVTSYMESILRGGDLMAGDMVDNSNTNEFGGIVPTPFYQFSTGDPKKIVAARKKGSEYWIVGVYENSSNNYNDTPYESTATFNLNGRVMTIKITRQGSSYYYNELTGVFYQVDGWHQWQYPTLWNKDIEIEAEVNDATVGTLKTYCSSAPDYRNYQTVVSLSANKTANYSFVTRDAGVKYLFVKASGNSQLECTLNGSKQTVTLSNGWQKMNFGTIPITNCSLVLKSLGYLEIDSISVTSNANKYPVATCVPPSAVISANNPTPCNGDTVYLSSSPGLSYQWSDGRTTQTINVFNNATYDVIVSNGQCSATSAPYDITFKACSICPAPTGLYNAAPNKYGFYVYWNKMTGSNGYTIYVHDATAGVDLIPYTKPKGNTATMQKFIGSDLLHPQLISKHKYEVYIVSNCMELNSAKSEIITVTTK